MIRLAVPGQAVLILVAWLMIQDLTSRQFWLLVLQAVGLRFLPFMLTAGPRSAGWAPSPS